MKTTPLSHKDIDFVMRWAERVIKVNPEMVSPIGLSLPGVYKNIPTAVAHFLSRATMLTEDLPFIRQRRFAQCAVIRTGQMTLDCQSRLPNIFEVKATLERVVKDMIAGHNEFVETVKSTDIPKHKITSRRQIFLGSSESSIIDKIIASYPVKPKLVLTSPPYPQIHILYNKWQILGRRETAAHYELANLKDGRGPSYYTMGSRSKKGLEDYFQILLRTFTNLRRLIDPNAIVVQLVAFPDEESIMARYLSMMQQAGFEPVRLKRGKGSELWCRTVPNRRWYAYNQEKQDSSHELFMVHKMRNQ